MQNEILDDFEALDKPKKQEKLEWKKWFPIFLMWLGAWGCRDAIFSMYLSYTLAFVGLSVGTVLCYYDWKKGVWFLCVLLFISSINFLISSTTDFLLGQMILI